MATLLERSDYTFLLLALKFCNKIDSYVEFLCLDEDEVEALKNANEEFSFVFNNKEKFGSCTNSFIRHQIASLRINLCYIAHRCRNSPNYSKAIGRDLGIEIPVFTLQAN